MSTVMHDLMTKTSLRLVLIPKPWWNKVFWLQNTVASRIMARFVVLKAGLGNWNTNLGEFAPSLQSGCVVDCLLCDYGENNEIHFIGQCPCLRHI